MRKSILFSLILLLLISFTTTSCTTVKKIFGKSASAEKNQVDKINGIINKKTGNDGKKLDEVSVLASGTDYALNKVTNKELPVIVAKDINRRVMSLVGKPNLEAEKEMWKTVDQLTSELIKEREQGEQSLLIKDNEIISIQKQAKILDDNKTKEINKYMKLAESTAVLADTRKAELDDYQGWFGLKAVGKGLWQFVKSIAWFLGIGAVLFLILRFASVSNPIAATIFGVFSMIGGYCIKCIQLFIPKAVEFSGHIATSAYNESKLLLSKIVDSIESIKQIQKSTGKDITLKEVLIELDKTLDASEKSIIDNIKKDLGY